MKFIYNGLNRDKTGKMKGIPPKHTQFKKGQSGNPNGRPKKPDLDQYLADALNEERNGIKAIEAVIKSLIAKAVKGDVRAAQLLLERGYGKPDQRSFISGTEDGPVIVSIHGNI